MILENNRAFRLQMDALTQLFHSLQGVKGVCSLDRVEGTRDRFDDDVEISVTPDGGIMRTVVFHLHGAGENELNGFIHFIVPGACEVTKDSGVSLVVKIEDLEADYRRASERWAAIMADFLLRGDKPLNNKIEHCFY